MLRIPEFESVKYMYLLNFKIKIHIYLFKLINCNKYSYLEELIKDFQNTLTINYENLN